MYVCVCRAISESSVRSAVESGETSVSGVFRRHGHGPECELCVNAMRETIHRCTQSQPYYRGQHGPRDSRI